MLEQRFRYREIYRHYKLKDTENNVIDVANSILIIEVNYSEGDGKNTTKIQPYHNQFIIKKSWLTNQKLKLMFGQHWLNDIRFYLPLLISVFTLIIMVVDSKLSKKENKNYEMILNSLQIQINDLKEEKGTTDESTFNSKDTSALNENIIR